MRLDSFDSTARNIIVQIKNQPSVVISVYLLMKLITIIKWFLLLHSQRFSNVARFAIPIWCKDVFFDHFYSIETVSFKLKTMFQ